MVQTHFLESTTTIFFLLGKQKRNLVYMHNDIWIKLNFGKVRGWLHCAFRARVNCHACGIALIMLTLKGRTSCPFKFHKEQLWFFSFLHQLQIEKNLRLFKALLMSSKPVIYFYIPYPEMHGTQKLTGEQSKTKKLAFLRLVTSKRFQITHIKLTLFTE